jgi:hypothetical protein
MAAAAVKANSTDWKMPDACWDRIFSEAFSSSSAWSNALR